MKINKSGFTLIELLVSISIIAILTALLTANFIGARQRGRDGQRKADLQQIRSALELYRADNGNYPTGAKFPTCGSCLSASGTCLATDTKYMQKIPCDPISGSSFSYTPTASCDNATTTCTTYSIYACLENGQDSEKDSSNLCTAPYFSYTLTNP